MESYNNVLGGGLKLKGGVHAVVLNKKKKHKKRKREEDEGEKREESGSGHEGEKGESREHVDILEVGKTKAQVSQLYFI
jgi:hypothetical protein